MDIFKDDAPYYDHLKSCINEANMGVGDRIIIIIPHADAVLIR
jgi:hypothetical protein